MVQQSDGHTGFTNKIDAAFRAHVWSTSIDEALAANDAGDAYNINTGIITLTDAAETPILYVKNNETQALHVRAIAVGIEVGASASTTILPVIKIIRNPKTGTIITSTPTNVDINSNRNYGSANTITIDAYKGATGDTMTDGDDHIIFFQGQGGRLFATIDEVLPKGSSIGIKIDPPTGNTSQRVYAALICHLEDPNT